MQVYFKRQDKMKKVLTALVLLLSILPAQAQGKKLFNGFDGGMMVHSGYLTGSIGPGVIPAKGLPTGIGGVIRLHAGNHLRVGSEGYVSTLAQRGNGSYVKYGWGGILADVRMVLGKVMQYAGLTVGGGSATTLLMEETPKVDWDPINGTIYHKQGFMALCPFAGCDFLVSEAMHLTLKADWLNCLGHDVSVPSGPRIYFGFLFYH